MTNWKGIVISALLTALLAPACGEPPEAGVVVSGVAVAGPVCPVETAPPDPACSPRPVADAIVLAVSDSGEIVEARTGDNGGFSFLLTPGRYEIAPQPVEGLMGTPQPFELEVLGQPLDLGVLTYDTGIR